jgi:hypothetical protein
MRVIAFVADLLFSSRIEATLAAAGHRVEVVEELPALQGALADAPADVLILDLHAGVTAASALADPAGVPVLAFGRHTEPALLRSAREAGCAECRGRRSLKS